MKRVIGKGGVREVIEKGGVREKGGKYEQFLMINSRDMKKKSNR